MNIVEKSKEKYLEYEKRHQDILDAAIRIFNSKGYGAATTAEIAQDAGVSEPTMYKHFPSKKDLFLDCYKSIAHSLLSEYREVFRKYREDEVGYLEGVTKVYFDFVKNSPHKSMFLVHLLSYKQDPDFERALKDFVESSVQGIERVLTKAKKKGKVKSKMDTHALACAFVNQYFTVVALKEFIDPKFFTEKICIQLTHTLLGIEES